MKKNFIRLVVWAASIIVVFVITWAVVKIINRTNGTISTGGERRRYLLNVPASYQPGNPTPLVISFHGFAEWPAHQQQISRWNELADERGFIVVYPMGTGRPLRWRTQEDHGLEKDVNFISALIDRLEGEYNIDPNRIYANGLSNGGGMSFALSCRLSERIAAIGTVAAAFTLPWEQCAPARPMAVMVFHGDDDPIVPFEGGPSGWFDLPFPNVDDWVAALAERNGCDPVADNLPDQGDARGVQFNGCDQDAQVIYYVIEGGGHTWPGGEPLPVWLTGVTTGDIDATRLMWEFFEQHPLE